MMETHEYLMPDYFPAFSCKMGECRTACCEGWPVSLSLEDYFRLTSLDCGPELRRRIDTGLRVKLQPTPDAYAEIAHRYDGSCPFRMEDGRCVIHAEQGEGALACVCRLYPRGVRLTRGYECSCANSCEAVIETLLHHPEPLRFIRQERSFDMPAPRPGLPLAPACVLEQEARMWLIGLVQDRALTLPQRLVRLGLALEKLETVRQNESALRTLLDAPFTPELPSLPGEAADLAQGMATMEALLALLDRRSGSIRDYGEAALAWFGQGEEAVRQHQAAAEAFDRRFPGWEVFFEHMLVNHMFFERFPFQDRPDSLWTEFVAICTVYALLRCLCLGWMATHHGEADLADVCAAAFRLIDHASFDRCAAHTLQELGCTGNQRILELLML